jgi:hypothetical protein
MIGRRGFLALASGLLVPRVAYSFAGGWALPVAFAELADGTILELDRVGSAGWQPGRAWQGEERAPVSFVHYQSREFAGRGPIKVHRIHTPECEAYYGEDGRTVYSSWRPGTPSAAVELKRGPYSGFGARAIL